MNHTPGPWKISEFWPLRPKPHYTISSGDADIGIVVSGKEDAQLIAAAPEMLDALRLVREVYEYKGDIDNNKNWVQLNNMNTYAFTAVNAVLAKLEESNHA